MRADLYFAAVVASLVMATWGLVFLCDWLMGPQL
jgi:hypothetical protein